MRLLRGALTPPYPAYPKCQDHELLKVRQTYEEDEKGCLSSRERGILLGSTQCMVLRAKSNPTSAPRMITRIILSQFMDDRSISCIDALHVLRAKRQLAPRRQGAKQ